MFQDTLKKLNYAQSFLRKQMIHLNLQLLYSCNFQCKICDFWKDDYYVKAPKLSVEQMEIIFKKLKKISPLVVSIGGGEPLLHPDLVEITKIIARDNFPVMICNGWFVTPQNAKELFKAGMWEVSISVDYANPEKHDAQRGKIGAFEHAINALQVLNENRVYPEQRVHMISVIMDDNLEEIESLIKLSKEIGVTYLITFYSNYRGKKESLASSKEISRRLLELKKKYPDVFLALPGFIERFSEHQDNPKGIVPCYAGRNLFNIDSQGEVTRCIDRLDNSAGNILRADLDEILKKLKTQASSNDCGACWTSCRGSIESMMYGKNKLKNYIAYHKMTKGVAIPS
jgi:MoaA/NifB/PqqE/SkfB family radical SAM enzyme